MRIDLYFKKILIFKKREEAKMMCDKKMIKINGRHIKPSKSIRPGDIIEIETSHGKKRIRVLKLPEGNINKDEIGSYYEGI